MYFTRKISTLIVGALLATSAVGELIQVPQGTSSDVVARVEVGAIRDLTSEEKIKKRADSCLSAIRQRRLLRRAPKNINIGIADWNSGQGQDTLKTTGLATCYGVAITGSYTSGGRGADRFLCHALEAERDPAEEMFDAVETARSNGLGGLYALLVYPDSASFTDGDGWTDEDRNDIQAEHDWYIEWITDATGGVAPEEKGHDYRESWGISISSNKGIQSGQFVG
ncbi:hypothetical protein F5X97DRAFT_345223 [Nemania serpens]|nr:hypothetical protein F5X97DRAFT_345223 [Nemania serpens]